MLGPYIKSRGTGGTKMSANGDLTTVETYIQGITIENPVLDIWAKMPKIYIYCGYLRSPRGIHISDSACLALRLSSHPYLCTCEIRKQSE